MSIFVQSAIVLIGRVLWLSLPFFATAAVMLLAIVPINLFRGWMPGPELGLIAAFFWAVYAPNLFPPAAIFALGLVQDFASGGPVGFWALIYLAAYGFTLSQRVFFIGRSLIGVWLGFAAVATIAGMAIWLLASTVYNRWVPPAEIFLQVAVTTLAFPLVGPLFLVLRRAMTTAPERL